MNTSMFDCSWSFVLDQVTFQAVYGRNTEAVTRTSSGSKKGVPLYFPIYIGYGHVFVHVSYIIDCAHMFVCNRVFLIATLYLMQIQLSNLILIGTSNTYLSWCNYLHFFFLLSRFFTFTFKVSFPLLSLCYKLVKMLLLLLNHGYAKMKRECLFYVKVAIFFIF